SGPIGCRVPGCSTGGGGLGRSASTLYQRRGISDSGNVIFVGSPAACIKNHPLGSPLARRALIPKIATGLTRIAIRPADPAPPYPTGASTPAPAIPSVWPMDLRIFTEPQQGASYDQQLRVAKAAEDAGFDAFFRSDHYLVMGAADGLPGPTDSWVTLAG